MLWEVRETQQEAGESCEEAEVMALGCDAEGVISTLSSLRLAHLIDFLSTLRDRGQTQCKDLEWAEVP